jgi:cytochrome c
MQFINHKPKKAGKIMRVPYPVNMRDRGLSAIEYSKIAKKKSRYAYSVLFDNTKIVFVIALFFLGVACGESEQGGEKPPEEHHMMTDLQGHATELRGTLEEARQMLGRAAAHYEEAGREQALKDFTEKKEPFIDRDLYVFCYGPDRTISGHGADSGLLGTDVDGLRDVDNVAFGTLIMEAVQESADEGFVEYKWLNPLTREVEPKVSIVRLIGEDVCGVGIYSAQ